MSKNKYKTSKQEKAEIRRQAFSSCQGKIKKLTTDKVYLMEKNKELESKLRELGARQSATHQNEGTAHTQEAPQGQQIQGCRGAAGGREI